MLYHAFDMQKSWLAGASALATAGAQAMQHPANPLGYFGASPLFASALEVFAHAAAPRGKPAFDLYETVVDGETVRVSEAVEARKPFGQLKHFKHKGTQKGARPEEHTSELQLLMRNSYAVLCLKKKNTKI